MPNVPVHDLLVHPRENDLVLGTYGRDFYITNIGPLQELSDAVLSQDAHLFTIKPTVQRIQWSFGANDYLFGQRHISTPNEPNGMVIRYYLKAQGTGNATIVIANASGQEVGRLQGPVAAGINSVLWSTRLQPAGPAGRGTGPAAGRGGGRGGANLDQLATLGEYTITLEVGGRTLTQKGRITKTQGWALGLTPQIIR
jgi:hypothetical protein